MPLGSVSVRRQAPYPTTNPNRPLSYHIGEIEDHSLGLVPSKTRVGDRFAVAATVDCLIAVLDVALDHEALDHALELLVIAACRHDLLDDTRLFKGILAGVRMVGVDDTRGVLEHTRGVQAQQVRHILIMIVRQALAVLVHIAAQDRVRIRIAVGLHLPAAIDEGMTVLRRGDGVHHDRQIAAGGVLHADGDIQPRGHQTVLLVLDRSGADRDIAEDVIEIAVVLGIEHLIRAGEAGLLQGADMHGADRDDALEHIGLLFGIGLMEHAFVARARGTRLIGIDARDDEDLVLHLVLHLSQAADIIQHTVLSVGGAGADDQHDAVIPARKDILHLLLAIGDDLSELVVEGIHLLDLHRDGQLALKFHIHIRNHNDTPSLFIVRSEELGVRSNVKQTVYS